MIELLFLIRVIQLSKKEIRFPQLVNLLAVQEDYRYCDSGFSYACLLHFITFKKSCKLYL